MELHTAEARRIAKAEASLGAWKGELRAMFRLAAPIVLTQLSWVAMMTTDVAMIGHLGADALAGASLSLMIFFLGYVVCFGVINMVIAE